MRRLLFLAGLLATCGLSLAAAGYQGQQAARAPIATIEKVKDNLFVIKNSDPTDRSTFTGGNTAVFVTANGVVLVDTKLPGYGKDILAQVKSVTDKPVTTIINTHTHSDHSGSNIEFPATVEYVVHENTKANMSKATCAPVVNCQSFKGDNAKYLPKRSYKDTLTLGAGKDRVDLYYFGRGHTNGDTWIVFPAVRTLHTGDMFQRKNMPFIDVENSGGSAVEWAATQSKALKGIKNVDTVIPGHYNGLMTWNDFKEGAAFYKDFLTTVQGGLKASKSADEMIAAYKVPDRFKHFQVDPQRMKANVQAIYSELKK